MVVHHYVKYLLSLFLLTWMCETSGVILPVIFSWKNDLLWNLILQTGKPYLFSQYITLLS